MQSQTFSPRDVAEIIGVSESTVKRWVDAGHIPVHRTQGGHRRIQLVDLLRFVREGDMPVLRPELLGMKDLAAVRGTDGITADAMYKLLVDGNAAAVRGSLLNAYLHGDDVASLMDDVIAPAFDRIGYLWLEGEQGVFVEHRATQICIEAVHVLRAVLPAPPENAPVLVGGVPPGDPYVLPALSVSTVLIDAGYRVVSLGPDTPVTAFLHAADAHRPDGVWVSATSAKNSQLQQFTLDLGKHLRERGLQLFLGGQAVKNGYGGVNGHMSVLGLTSELVEALK